MQKISITLKSFLGPLLSILTPSPHPLATTDLISVPTALSVVKCHINGIMQYTVFYVCLLSPGIMLSKFIHDVECIRSTFVSMAE